MTERTQRMKTNLVATRPRICPDRAFIYTQVYQKTKGEPMILRRAKAFGRVLSEMPIFILNDELLIGHQASIYYASPIYPEYGVGWIEDELDTFPTRAQDPFDISKEAAGRLKEIFPYWRGNSVNDYLFKWLPGDTREARLNSKAFSITAHEAKALGHVLLRYELVMRVGLREIISQAEQRLHELDMSNPTDLGRSYFYQAVILVCNAIISYVHRYGDLAKHLSLNVSDAGRKEELDCIAELCYHVPENPARNFYEALQSFLFLHVCAHIESNGSSITPGRMDQYLYPYYESDLRNGRITEERAQELIE